MWRLAVILLLVFITIKIAHGGEEPFVNPVQQAIMDANKVVSQVYKKYKNTRPLRGIEESMPLDDFRFVFKPKILKSIKKHEFRYRIGFKFTF